MRIIKSKYTSEYLKSLIQKEESRIETELLEKIEKKAKTNSRILMVCAIFSPAIILCAAIPAISASLAENLAWPWFSFFIAGVLVFFCCIFILSSSFEESLFRYYSKKGHILKNPYDKNFQEIARLIEIGEQLDTFSLRDDNFIAVAGQCLAVCSSKEQKIIKIFDLDKSYEGIIRDDCLDFSEAFDQDIEEYIRKAGDE